MRPTDAIGFGVAPLRHALAIRDDQTAVEHGIGGPVNQAAQPMILHSFEVAGASRLFPRGPNHDLFSGGDLRTLHRRAVQHVAEVSTENQDHSAVGLTGTAQPAHARHTVELRVLHGRAAWAPGQLEGEIRAGAWILAPDLAGEFALRKNDGTMWEQATLCVQGHAIVPP